MDFYHPADILQRFSAPVFRLRDFALAGALQPVGEHNSTDQKARRLVSASQSLLHAVPEVFFNG
jgi:hypothetical protein